MLPLRAFLSNCRAASAVEFALLTPVFVLMLTGMLAYSIYFGAAHSVQQIAADAARTSIAGLNGRERDALVAAYIDNNAADYLLIERARLSYTIGDKASDPSQYQVSIDYDASALPIWNLYPPLPLPSKTIRFSSSIRRGGL
ncbi:pilus assembly protein [Devosia rhodophyticola]|uniref:Pilus assembly protein n=1 Tax=Devosia rhodophyticola TaxID=3026423 RepID=A0ABY7Z2B9_9HYPH|nr:TadE/TadG family type IV pilus assembly protein [Devosia rhodophyticola]WDR07140.1 pilus assembly protein [Devosia rhodophyticola]